MSTKMRLVLAVLGVAALGGFWFKLIVPKRAESAKVAEQIAQARARLATAERAAESSEQARTAYQRDYATLARLGKAVPADDDMASLVYQLESVTRANKIDFRAVKLSGGTGPAKPAAAKAKPSDGGSEKDDEAAPAPSATPAAPPVSQAPPGAVVGRAGLLTLPFTFTFEGGYLPMQRLLGAIEGLAEIGDDGTISVRGRLLTVDGFALAASSQGFPKVKAQVGATAYIVPATEGVTGGATPQGPAGGPATAPGAPSAAAPAAASATATATAGATAVKG